MSKEVEKAIKKLNSIVKVHKDFLKGCNEETISEKEIEALEIALNYIKELEEFNRAYIRQLNGAFDRGFIHKDKIRDKIEEIKLNIKESKDVLYGAENIVSVLNELLEEE